MSERFMGEFDPKVTYKKGDVVTLNGEAYRRVRDDGGKVDPFQTMPHRVWQKKSAASGGLVSLLGLGGGGTSDAVQYIPQELTEAQQMQARKNLGVYYKTDDIVELVPLTRVIPKDAGDMGYAAEIPRFEIVPGKRYRVEMNGESFEVTPVPVVLDKGTLYYLGSAVDTSSMAFVWDYPFSFMSPPYAPDITAVYFQNAGEYEISVSGDSVVYSRIPPEYLPTMPFCINITPSPDYEGEFVADKSYSEVKEAEAQKRPIIGTFKNSDGLVYTLIGCDGAEKACYFAAFDVRVAIKMFKIELMDSENNIVRVYQHWLSETDITE